MGDGSIKVVGLSYENKAFEFDDVYRLDRHVSSDQLEVKSHCIESNRTSKNTDTHIRETNLPSTTSDLEGTEAKTIQDSKHHGDDEEVPDGGWGWIVAAGAFSAQVVVNILMSCYGILYSKFLLNLGTSAVFSAWIFNVMGFIFTFTGIFARTLVEEFGCRTASFVGIMMLVFGVMITAVAESAWFLLVFYSLIAGMGTGIMAPIAYTIVPFYFKKYMGTANAIMSSGVSFGQMIGPVLITYLEAEYAFQGAAVMLGGVLLHSLIGITVFHPVEWHLKCPREKPKPSKTKSGSLKIVLKMLKSTFSSLKLMRSPVASIIAIGGTLNLIGYLNFLSIMPFAMQEDGFPVDAAATGISVSGITNLCTRFFVSVAADFSWFNMRYCYMTGTVVMVTCSIAFCFLGDLTAITVLMGFWGCGVGAYMALYNLIMVKYLGKDQLLSQLGVTNFFSSIWFLSCGPILGAIRDISGSYTVSIIVLAGTVSITFILYLCLPAAVRYEERKKLKMMDQEKS